LLVLTVPLNLMAAAAAAAVAGTGSDRLVHDRQSMIVQNATKRVKNFVQKLTCKRQVFVFYFIL
jgi:ribosomal protein L4